MKGALIGIAVTWSIMFAIVGIIWVCTNYPEVAVRLAYAVFVTLFGAFWGWVSYRQDEVK